MADTNDLPEGTDSILDTNNDAGIGGASAGRGASGSTSANLTRTANLDNDATDDLIEDNSNSGGIRGLFSNATDKIRDEAGSRTRGFVGQGLERGSATLTNISTLVGDTVSQIEEKLGPQYGDYARNASQTLNRYAESLANKNPDELVDDARTLVRKSPGIAIGAAAVIGFGLIRLIKAGIDSNSDARPARNTDR